MQPEYGSVRDWQEQHWADREVMLGFGERDLVRWLLDADFERVSLRYDLDYSRETVPPELIESRVSGRPNPTMPSVAEAARGVLGEAADQYLDRYRELLATEPSKLLRAVAHVTAVRARD